ncbi:MAG: hypothetical protein ACRD0C_02900, partial [Acidimicrobiia bacterium]
MPTKRTVVAVIGVLLPLALNLPASPLHPTRSGHVSPESDVTPAPGVTASPAPRQDGLVIRLAAGAFDPLQDVPAVADPLRDDATGHLLVQMHPPASPAVREVIAGAGGRITGFLPDATYLVGGRPGTADALRRLASVRWVGPYHPAYKLSPALESFTGGPVHVYTHP